MLTISLMRLRLPVLCALALMALACRPALAQEALRGVALVIGNGAYEHLSVLPNPEKDARAVEALLADLGFDTNLTSDRDARRLARDLRDFVEDAEGADVAVLYYAGHGIEAGGENWLVPVDADFSSLDDAEAKLVPLSRIVAELRETVAVTIVLLDACRDNPFPADAVLTLPGGETAPISAGGLAMGDGRGASRLGAAPAPAAPADEALGIVIGFAAEPGKVALDGAPGGNSPYAAALVRHLSAMNGDEFGMVMRMVGEEVFLKTRGAQRPWMNESLRRMLTFGAAPPEPEGPEGTILTERRRLLVTISDLPDPERRRIQKVAEEGGVPMDALFAVLKAMGEEAPSDPAALEALLRAKVETLRGMMARQQALTTSDPEIARLMELADRAIAEGALDAALEFQFQAYELMEKQREEIQDVQKDINARILEFADIDERRAETFLLAFKHRFAAEEYEGIAMELETIDPERSYRLARKAIDAYIEAGRYGRGAIEQVAGYDLAMDTLAYAENNLGAAEVAEHKSQIAYLLFLNGEVIRKVEQVEEARVIFEEIVPVLDEHGTVAQRIEVRRRHGALLMSLGSLTGDAATLAAAVATLNEAAGLVPADEPAAARAGVMRALAIALARLGAANADAAPIERAVSILEPQLAGLTPEAAPLEWASAQEALGEARQALGIVRDDAGPLAEAVAHFRAALGQRPQERMPRAHNDALFALAEALREYGIRTEGTEALAESAALHQAALADRHSDYENRRWTDSVVARGLALEALSRRSGEAADLADAVASYNEAFFIFRRVLGDTEPELFLENSLRIATALEDLARLEGKPSRLLLAVEARQNALDVAATLPRHAARLPALAAALAAARAELAAAGDISPGDEGPVRARFETETDAWALIQLESGIRRLEQAREFNTQERWNDAVVSFQAGLDASFAGVPAAERARLRLGVAESLAGLAMLEPQAGHTQDALAAADAALAHEALLGAAAIAQLRADIAYLLAVEYQGRTAGSGPTADAVPGLVRAAAELRLALTAIHGTDAGTWPDLADHLVLSLVDAADAAPDRAALGREAVGLAAAALAATAETDIAGLAMRERLLADAHFRPAGEPGAAELAAAEPHARRAVALYAGLARPLDAAFANETLCTVLALQARAARDGARAAEAVEACAEALDLGRRDPGGDVWEEFFSGQLDSAREILEAVR